MATTLNAGTTTATALAVTTDTSGAMAIQTSGTTAISISSAQVVSLANPLLPASGGTGLTALGTGVATFLGTPSSANLASAVTDETGSGALVFATSPTLVTPALGTPASGVLTNCTGTAAGLSIGGTAATATTANALNTGNAYTGTAFSDSLGNLRNIPISSKITGYTLVATDNGQCISITTGGVTVPNSVFSAGQTVAIFNNSASSQTITQGAGVTMYLSGAPTTLTGNRTLGGYGLATILFISSSVAVITGAGLS